MPNARMRMLGEPPGQESPSPLAGEEAPPRAGGGAWGGGGGGGLDRRRCGATSAAAGSGPGFGDRSYCPQGRLIVEVDGECHAERQVEDARLTARPRKSLPARGGGGPATGRRGGVGGGRGGGS